MAVQSAASPLAAQAGATSTWTAHPSTCQMTTQTAAPATLTRRQTPTPSNRSSDRLFPHRTLFPNCVSPTPKVHMDSSQTTQKIRAMRGFYSSWAEHAWQPFFSIRHICRENPPPSSRNASDPECHGTNGHFCLTPFSSDKLLVLAVRQHHLSIITLTPVPSHQKSSALLFRYKVLFIQTKLCV